MEKYRLNKLKSFGLTEKHISMRDDLEDLKKYSPSFVLCVAELNCTFQIEDVPMPIKKGDVLCMAYGLYEQLSKSNGRTVLTPYRKKFKEFYKPYTGKEDLSNKKLFVCRTGGIGDILFSQSVIQQIKEKYPSCSITYATIPRHMPAVGLFPMHLIDQVAPIPFALQMLKDHNYHIFFEGVIERCKESESRNCYDLFNEYVGLKFDKKYNPVVHIMPKFKEKYINHIPKKTVLIQPRASSVLRTMNSEQLESIISKLQENGFTVGIIDSPERKFIITSIIDKFDDQKVNKNKIINFAAMQTSIMEGAAILSLCEGAITVDSAHSHIAAALGIPVVTLFGPFKGELRMKYYEHGDWVEPPIGWNECGKFRCFFHEGRLQECPYIQRGMAPGCMESIVVDDVINKFMTLHRNKFHE